MKDWFKARNCWGAMILSLSDAEAGRLCKALWRYTMTGEQSDLSGAEKAIFPLFAMTLSQDEELSEKRAAAGSIGGKQTQANSSKLKQTEASDEFASKNKNKNKNKNKSKNKEEEQDIDNNSSSCAEPSSTPDENDVFFRLPTVDGREYPVTFTDIEKARTLYPAVDIEQEIRNMCGWLDGHPSNRKTWNGMRRFINGWLSRSQNTAKAQPRPHQVVNAFAEYAERLAREGAE